MYIMTFVTIWKIQWLYSNVKWIHAANVTELELIAGSLKQPLDRRCGGISWGKSKDCQSAGNQVSSVLSLFIYDISEVMCAHAQACCFFSLKIGILVVSEVNANCDICLRFPHKTAISLRGP